MAALQDEHAEGNIVGLNLTTGQPMDPIQEGVYDSFRVLRNCIASSTGIASNLLLCDEMLKARQMVSLGSIVLHETLYRPNVNTGSTSGAWGRRRLCRVNVKAKRSGARGASIKCRRKHRQRGVRKYLETSNVFAVPKSIICIQHGALVVDLKVDI